MSHNPYLPDDDQDWHESVLYTMTGVTSALGVLVCYAEHHGHREDAVMPARTTGSFAGLLFPAIVQHAPDSITNEDGLRAVFVALEDMIDDSVRQPQDAGTDVVIDVDVDAAPKPGERHYLLYQAHHAWMDRAAHRDRAACRTIVDTILRDEGWSEVCKLGSQILISIGYTVHVEAAVS